MNDYIEFIVTAHCKFCGEVISLELSLVYEQAQKMLREFASKHNHQDPWDNLNRD